MKNTKSAPDRLSIMRRQKRNRAVVITVLIFLLIAGTVLSLTFCFNIATIEISGTSSVYTNDEILANSKIKNGQSIFLFSAKKVADELGTKLPYLDNIKVVRKLPDTVVIDISETKNSLVLPYAGGGLVLSKSLKILDNVSSPPDGFVKIYGLQPGSFNVGGELMTEAEGGTEYLQSLVSALDSCGLIEKTSMINVGDKLNLSLVYDNRLFVMIGTANNLEYKVKMLKKLVETELSETDVGNLDLSVSGKGIFKPCELTLPEGYQNFAQLN
ncbi:MAG: FtsQ-type POTRA domain-containing protein [Oscillospiraceae bacterium]